MTEGMNAGGLALTASAALAAAMYDLSLCAPCRMCRYDEAPSECERRACADRSRCFEWRGPTEEFLRKYFDTLIETGGERK